MKRAARVLLGAGSALVVLCLAVFLLHGPLLRGVASWMSVAEEPVPADLIYVLNGEIDTRPFRAAELYRVGLAPIVVVPRVHAWPAETIGILPNEGELNAEVLRRQGVPDSAIVLLPEGASSTWEEAAILAGYLRTHPARSVIVVTSAFHTRRARWAMRRQLEGLDVSLQMAGAPSVLYDERNWWLSEEGLVRTVTEIMKLFYYPLRY